MSVQILLVEDEALFAKSVGRRLEKAGYRCVIAPSLAAAETALREHEPELILLDMRLPDGSGLDFLQRLRQEFNTQIPVIVMTAYGEIEDAVTAMKFSAADYLKKPIDLDELLLNVEKVLDHQRVSRQLQYSRTREANAIDGPQLIGGSNAIKTLEQQIRRIASLSANPGVAPPTVLIVGETGTGKDVAARLLHQHSSRAAKPFVHVDCAALPKDLIEAELFGHMKGAFTHAVAERTGLIEAAEDGIVFLDEIGELPLELQAKLLAVLERRSLRRIGSSVERKTTAWFVAATNRDVNKMVAEGTLRSDLYFRLNVLTLTLVPLRERDDDVLLLAEHFGQQTAKRYGFPGCTLTADARHALRTYRWPGNVRELRHVIERATLLSPNGQLTAENLMLPVTMPANPGMALELEGLTLDQAERLLIETALKRCGNNVSEAARSLGVTRMAMRYRMQRHGL